MGDLAKLFRKCRESDSSLPLVLLRHAWFRLRGKDIIANHRVMIRGAENIITQGPLQIGLGRVGFMHRFDRTWLNVRGQLRFHGKFSIGKGCRFDIGPQAVVSFGEAGQITAASTFIIMHGLEVGRGCTISWGCEFLDEDFHDLAFTGKIRKENRIVVGDNVWIGANVLVLKGSRIPSGCVAAAGSVVTKAFEQENCLIAGNPAKVIREDIRWK